MRLALTCLLVLVLAGCVVETGDPGGSRAPTAFSGRTLSIDGPPLDVPAEQQADMNIKLRGLLEVQEARALVEINGPTDDRAPRINSIFDEHRVPGMLAVYKVGVFSGLANGVEGGEAVQVVEYQTRDGEAMRTPASGYDIGDGLQALVLFADEDSVLLKYTRQDWNRMGYGVHLLGIEVDPKLLSAYRSCAAAGRSSMPALAAGEAVGRARGRVRVAIRDTGSFMDPRSRKDWYDSSATVEPAPAAPAPQPPPKPTQPPPQPGPQPPPQPGPQPPPQPAPQPGPGQGLACTSNGVGFQLVTGLQACGTVELTVSAGAAFTWVMAGVAPAGGAAEWRGGASDVSCASGSCRWTFRDLKVPCGTGPFTVHFRRDAVGDDPSAGTEVASCQP